MLTVPAAAPAANSWRQSASGAWLKADRCTLHNRLHGISAYDKGRERTPPSTAIMHAKVWNRTWLSSLQRPKFCEAGKGGKGPPARTGHSCTVLPDGRLLIFGGLADNGKCMNDMFVIDVKRLTWFKMTAKGAPPKGRAYHS